MAYLWDPPWSPVLADMVLEDLEVDCLKGLAFNVSVFYRYVDDVFTILPKDKVSCFCVQQ